jgi:serine/threonine protein kinase
VPRCLNPHLGQGHDNAPGSINCHYCDFLVQGARINIYEVLSFVGTGSYGHVYQVREPDPLNRVLALKVLRLDKFNAKAQANFFQEVRQIANMQHPNILPIYNFGLLPNSQRPYFVMEYAPQTIVSLFRNPDGSRRLAFVEELIPYIEQTAGALRYVHEAGLIHQDVKPGNLLIGRSGQVLLADFGTAYYLGMQTHASLGEVTGTAAFMPPEQWQGAPRRESDQYALAICCYELLCGRPPFTYTQVDAMWRAHMNEQLPSPQKWNPRVPIEVSSVLQRALAKDYRRRYPNILDFAEQYANAVHMAQQYYLCHECGTQNRTGAHRCAFCGADQHNRACPYCGTLVRFGQRCCTRCGRLTLPPNRLIDSPLIGTSTRQGRYILTQILKHSEDTRTMSAIAIDTLHNERRVMLKRWECSDGPTTQRASDIAHYDRATAPLAHLRHPLIPTILDRFAEGRYYYIVYTYIDGESIEERLVRTQQPLPESLVLDYMNKLLNILLALEGQRPLVRHYDISPANIIIEQQRGRVFLTGFQVPPPPIPHTSRSTRAGRRTTRKLVVSPYLPIQDKPFDARTCIYALAATMYHALTTIAPPHYPTYPPIRLLNPSISPTLEAILSRALAEDNRARYQSYRALQQDVQRLIASTLPFQNTLPSA